MLPGCLESLEGQVDRVVVVDGAYADFPHDRPYSTDETREIARCYGAEWIGCPRVGGAFRAWRDEVEKRNAYLVGEEGDWYFQIDADERLVGRIAERRDGALYSLMVCRGDGRTAWAQRIFQQRGDTRYEGTHYAVWRDGDLLRARTDWVRIPARQARLVHLTHLRDVERQRAKRAYRKEMVRRERGYREAYQI